MGYFKLIVPESTTNLFVDTSFALADPDTQWTIVGDGGGGEDFARGTTYSYYGFSSATATLGGSAWADLRQTVTTTATSYTLSCMVRRDAGGVPTATHTRAYWDDAVADWDSITSVGGGWYLCVKTATPTAAANEFGVRALEASLSVDGVQLENKAYHTTYCDGDMEGCYFTGAAHASTSTRSAQSRAGGKIADFETDYTFEVADWQGWGVPPHLLNLDAYALLPGAQVGSIKTGVNTLTLTGYFQGSSLSNLHALRQALVEELAHDRYPQTAEGWQPIRIWYTGASVWKEARVFYDSGLEGSSMVRRGYTETIPIRFLMADPFWYEIGNSATQLAKQTTVTLRYAAGRLKSTGQWDDLGLTANPDTGGTVNAICAASDGSIYFGGVWTDWNNAAAGRDYIVKFIPSTETWSTLVGANDVNARIYDIKEGPDGTIYLCGMFTDVNGVAANDFIVSYNPTADTWAPLGAPGAAITSMRAMAFDSSGNLYVVGDFTAVAGVANTAYIAKWDGAAWSAVGTPTVAAGYPFCIAIDSQDNIVIGGTFTDFDGVASADYLARWNGTAWADLGSGTQTGDVSAVRFSNDDVLYLGGTFTNQGGDADCDYVCAWNGKQFLSMANGPTTAVSDMDIASNGVVYVVGSSCSISAWNGAAWTVEDITPTATFTAIAIGQQDPVISSNYDIWAGFNASAARFTGGSTTVTNDGTAAQYPVIYLENNDTTAGYVYTIRNETTGKGLMLNYYLLAGETLTIDCRPGQKSITSSMYGPRPDAILANCDFGTFALQSGANQITAFTTHGVIGSLSFWMEWKDAYRGMD